MAIITHEDFPALRAKFKGKKIIFTSGSFDLVHAGHVVHLEACKALGDILVVGVGRDEDIKRHKGDKRPILNEHVRLKMIDSLKPVDYTFFIKPPASGAHLASPLIEVFHTLRPDIYATNDEATDLNWYVVNCREAGVSFSILHRNAPPEFDDISTTKITKKILELFT